MSEVQPISHPEISEFAAEGLTIEERKLRFSYALRQVMAARKMRSLDLAEVIGVRGNTVNRWLNRRNMPDVLKIGDLSIALGVLPEFLVFPPPVPKYPIEEYVLYTNELVPEISEKDIPDLELKSDPGVTEPQSVL